jgi:hypothetical protein
MSSHNFTAVRLLPLTIRRPSGATFNVEISEDDTVFELKKMIQAVAGIPVEEQSLQIRGKIREEHLSLKKHGLVGGETVILCENFILECTYALQRLVLTPPRVDTKLGRPFPKDSGEGSEISLEDHKDGQWGNDAELEGTVQNEAGPSSQIGDDKLDPSTTDYDINNPELDLEMILQDEMMEQFERERAEKVAYEV